MYYPVLLEQVNRKHVRNIIFTSHFLILYLVFIYVFKQYKRYPYITHSGVFIQILGSWIYVWLADITFLPFAFTQLKRKCKTPVNVSFSSLGIGITQHWALTSYFYICGLDAVLFQLLFFVCTCISSFSGQLPEPAVT